MTLQERSFKKARNKNVTAPEPPHPPPHRMALLRVSMALVCASKRCENVHMFVAFPSSLFFSNVIRNCTKLGTASRFLMLFFVARGSNSLQITMRKALLRFPVPASKNGCGSQMICKLQYELAPSCAPYPNLGANNNDAGYNVRCSAHVLYLEKSEMFVLLSFEQLLKRL